MSSVNIMKSADTLTKYVEGKDFGSFRAKDVSRFAVVTDSYGKDTLKRFNAVQIFFIELIQVIGFARNIAFSKTAMDAFLMKFDLHLKCSSNLKSQPKYKMQQNLDKLTRLVEKYATPISYSFDPEEISFLQQAGAFAPCGPVATGGKSFANMIFDHPSYKPYDPNRTYVPRHMR